MPDTPVHNLRVLTQTQTEFSALVDAVVSAKDFGVASAAKRGSNPDYPYVPIIKVADSGLYQTYNPARRRAFATRDEAVAYAQQMIDAYRASLRERLLTPRYRAEREQYGLPREMPTN